MIENIKLEVAQLIDINGILALQELYLVSNLSDKEKEAGFVTTHSLTQLAEIIAHEGLFIAKTTVKSSRTSLPEVGFLCQWPILIT
jgi:hypothetical protein